MSVDNRLLGHFQASREREESARRALAGQRREDPPPGVEQAEEVWARAVARVREQRELLTGVLVWPSEDR